MAAVEGAIVIAHAVQVVDELLVLDLAREISARVDVTGALRTCFRRSQIAIVGVCAAWTVRSALCLALDEVARHVQASHGEVYMKIQLPTAEYRIPLVRESLEVNDEELWRVVDLDLLESWHVLLTFGTVPFVVAGQSLLLAEAGQAVVDVHIPLAHGEGWQATSLLLGLELGGWGIQVDLPEDR